MKNTVNAKIQRKFGEKLKAERGNIKWSVEALISRGSTITGESSYSGGWAKKRIWTDETVQLAESLGIAVESGNNAPRGGANGEYVALVSDRRKNKLIHAYIDILARKGSIELARGARKIKEEEERAKQETEKEYALVKPYALNYTARILKSKKMSGPAKSEAQRAILMDILKDAGLEKLQNFWKVWQKVSAFVKQEAEEKVKKEIERKKKECEKKGDQFITKDFFHEKTGACYSGINNFLKERFGTENIKGLPLSEVIAIVPASYSNKLTK